VILTGDFNEPSCLDWTEKSRLANVCPIVVDYPATRRIGNVGMVDSWRATHPNEVTDQGLTWTPLTSRDDPADHHDRIDFIFASADSIDILDCEVMGEHANTADIVVTPWPSDHRSVVATVTIPDNRRADVDPAIRRQPHPSAITNPHAPGEVDHPNMVPFIVRRPSSLPGIVLDETEAFLQGEWQYSTHTPPWVGLGYLHDRKSNKGGSSITWTPDLPNAGVYEVRISHCRNIRRASNTPVTIHHADGESVVRIDQQSLPNHGSLFRSIGQYRFEKGKSGWVRISNEGTDGKYVVADAVQFLPE